MSSVLWPKPNPAADRLCMKMLSRVSPGWAMRMGEADVSPVEAVDLLWEWNPLFAGHRDVETGLASIEEADDALLRLAEGTRGVLATLSPAAITVLKARHSIALAGATTRIVSGDTDPIMRLPHGLTREERQTVLLIRLLFSADMTI